MPLGTYLRFPAEIKTYGPAPATYVARMCLVSAYTALAQCIVSSVLVSLDPIRVHGVITSADLSESALNIISLSHRLE